MLGHVKGLLAHPSKEAICGIEIQQHNEEGLSLLL